MKKFFVSTALFFGFFSCAFAQYAQVEGIFASHMTELQTILLGSGDGTMAASAFVTLGACSGHIAGIGHIKGRTLTFKSHEKIEGGEGCVMTVEFDSTWKKAKITEGEGCTAFHGVSCGWEGDVALRKSYKK